MGRIIVFGATGYTGDLTVRRLGADPDACDELVLAGRNESRLEALADEVETSRSVGPKLWVEVADVSSPRSVRDLLRDSSDVLISTVGPFIRWGRPAVDAAVAAGATYLDSTGEPKFIRQLFDEDSARAEKSGARLLTAFGYDYVPGNLAGALAIDDAIKSGHAPTRVDVGYFMPGGVGMSSGTAATGAGIVFEPSYAFSDGKLRVEHAGKNVRSFDLDGKGLQGISVGGTEQFGLPRQLPTLKEVRVFIGATGKFSRPMSVASRGLNALIKIPGVKNGLQTTATKFVKGSRGGPDERERAEIRSVAIAEAYDAEGTRVARVVVSGPSPYDLTADALAWGAMNADKIKSVGTLAPTDAFDLATFTAGCASFGLTRD